MREPNTSRLLKSNQAEESPHEDNQVILRIIQASANDNMMPATHWFSWVIFWTILVGGLLAYVVF